MIGQLIGIGMGPGDPELITVKAYRVLKESPVIAYPKKRMGEKSYALSIAETYINPLEKEMLGLVFPMTRDREQLEREWERTVEAVWQRLSQGKNVAFVTEGDPLLYSTFIHMSRRMQELHPQVAISSVPGISSINGAASRLNLPLADGDEQIAIVPATEDRQAMRKALTEHDAVVFLKVAKVLDLIIDLLEELNLSDKAMVVSKVTSDQEMVWKNVAELKGQKPGYLTLMVVRK
ncbi:MULTISPECIES: precorrin-2 C(20)-methyltransferase [Thermoactinomyces]|jgi:precorrin-2/cobalt-factor-2 C20-methyltransferase|uniref:Precorrin-2 C(20)-methyltransferase n=1 Tax=Thermoactinomyces daqus TaxID=1329516 RepID=A0A7W2AIC7_9BACL|nr:MULTISPECIES: precorrin-2 C(20)-methyltransferase [Thermoactinomyces]MBA4544107.1 precorrin-2 C(20)-methyltransferase [Thermoactinomyces daqus]MBH8608211.1 precorrin-2 C(20)-methyltransferase [Thermoactinomyces sp. CICC 10521]